MKNAVLVLILSVSGFSLNAQITFDVKTAVPVDSIFFSNITQDNEFQFIRYSPSLQIKLNRPLNDLYNFTFYGSSGKRMNQVWLNGDKIIIKGNFTGKKLEVDTVIGSDIYYTSLDFRKRYDLLIEHKADSATVNNFLLNELTRNLNHVFSIEIAQAFFYRNVSNKSELLRVYNILAGQDAAVRSHLLNPYPKIGKVLFQNSIDFRKFTFNNPEGKIETIALAPGKKYLVDMWFAACAPCIEQHKEITARLDVLKQNNIEVIGISIDQNQKQWAEFVTTKNYRWKNLRETDDPVKMLRTDMLIEVYPTYFLLDSNGNILFRSNSFREVTEHLKFESAQ
ncbi:MAG TPA: TlpA disulfide reductase family protein [Cyclobacteriaceae bacterium]|nr:TlpA family protein disulfide reductase [Cyclobacteriaceae bacterium]HMV08872.1 TlpA disulfide reductase family protein [Cyclobacteriaceae bacterium]HMV89297.1 TlpA disulfide reductase family protein [Cyclobacteriaceae bacterium]HMX00373.1 TlpA disulfide reductase family protein [Cyclobacteriaceae bacterium]HMX49628.1 TlpA disulfide reductase family protein [Cyclobacteriaceae bacterium]